VILDTEDLVNIVADYGPLSRCAWIVIRRESYFAGREIRPERRRSKIAHWRLLSSILTLCVAVGLTIEVVMTNASREVTEGMTPIPLSFL